MMTDCYTAITFAPVQGFIEKSRKLRDLYGSSFILSYLATAVCDGARAYFDLTDATWPNDPVISPARINVAQGTPNQIIIRGNFPEKEAYQTLQNAWKALLIRCRQWIETEVTTTPEDKPWQYFWERPWREWINHTWEFFWATGDTIDAARHNINQIKYARAWTGINYTGESSTLSGQDSRAWPALGRHASHSRTKAIEENEVKTFYQQLSQAIDDTGSSISIREQLSIPELVKRLVTIDDVISPGSGVETPRSFKQVRRWTDINDETPSDDLDRENRWTGWFQGDGDRAGDYLQRMSQQAGANPEEILHEFSYQLRQWGNNLGRYLPRSKKTRKSLTRDGRIIYAGGDDFLGTLYRNPPDDPLMPQECLNWFYHFKSEVWESHQQPITVSTGFVWASPQVPQRDILQHCRLAESSAKTNGRDRIALRILFSGGKYLEWQCPWRFLRILEDYRDRNQKQNWTHLYNDAAVLENRHAFMGNQSNVARELLKIYFPIQPEDLSNEDLDRRKFYTFLTTDKQDADDYKLWKVSDILWNLYRDVNGTITFKAREENSSTGLSDSHEHISTGIFGDREIFEVADDKLDMGKVHNAFNNWVINLTKVGFHLCSNT